MIMLLSPDAQTRTLTVVGGHLHVVSTALELFRTFETAASADQAVVDLDQSITPLNESVNADTSVNERLKNEWALFARALSAAYADFGRDIVARRGYDEKNHVRSFALNTAAGALTRLRTNAREHLITQIEAIN